MLRNNFIRFLFLAVAYAGVKHYTGHNCIAIAAVSSLLFLAGAISGPVAKQIVHPKFRSPEEVWARSGDNRSGRA